jgi:hypothetical protein
MKFETLVLLHLIQHTRTKYEREREREREKLLVGSSVVCKQSRESKKEKLIAKTQNMLRNNRCIDINPVEYQWFLCAKNHI